MNKIVGLRKRWLANTLSIIFAVGLVCVLAATAFYAMHDYSNLEFDMRFRSSVTMDIFEDFSHLSDAEFYESCGYRRNHRSIFSRKLDRLVSFHSGHHEGSGKPQSGGIPGQRSDYRQPGHGGFQSDHNWR